MPNQIDQIKNACAYIDAGEMRGTGYLVAPNIAVTCNHVVNRVTNGQPVALRFGDQTHQARILVRDPDADCAILELTTPITGVTPLSLTPNDCNRGDPWEAYGFPSITGEAGHFLSGDVQDPLGKDPWNTEAIVLYSREIAAAEGAPPQGFSGTPVMVGGYVVGHLKKIIPGAPTDNSPSRAMMGTLYACPSRLVTKLLPASTQKETLKLQPPTTGYDPAWYVKREDVESIAMNYLEFPGAPVVLWGPFRSGKTTTLKYLIERVRNDASSPSTIVTVNLGLFAGESKESLDALLKEMATVIVQELGEDPNIVKRLWEGFGSPVNKITRLMEMDLLPKIQGRLILAIDRADEVWRRRFKSDFFSLLRGWADDADTPVWSRLRLILAISSSPLLMIEDPGRSPFNLTDPIELNDLEDDQILDLARRYGLFWNSSDLKSVRDLVGGQPYLLRALMYRAGWSKTTPLQQLLSSQNLKKVYGHYFEQYRAWLHEKAELSEELSRFSANATLPSNNREACHTLTRAGLLVEEQRDRYRLRYGLYQHLFN